MVKHVFARLKSASKQFWPVSALKKNRKDAEIGCGFTTTWPCTCLECIFDVFFVPAKTSQAHEQRLESEVWEGKPENLSSWPRCEKVEDEETYEIQQDGDDGHRTLT